ncbi:hypothetical protein OQA88_7 [Cercophora sp. LCS_1]
MDRERKPPGRRLIQLFRALREPGQQHPGLPAISKRVTKLTTTFRSILPTKTLPSKTALSKAQQLAKDMKHGAGADTKAPPAYKLEGAPAGGALSLIAIDQGPEEPPIPPQPETGEKRKRSDLDGHDERPKSSASAKAKDERTLQWIETSDFAPHPIDDVPPQLPPSRSDSGAFGSVPEDTELPSEYMRTWPVSLEKTYIVSAAKARVLRESQHDQFALARRDTFDSRLERTSSVCTSQNPSVVSLTDGHMLARRGSETTVGTSTSAVFSDRTSIKRLSASTAFTVLSTSVSSEMLPKRIRPDSRTSSFQTRSIPSPRSSAHSSFSAALKARSSLQREVTGPKIDNPPPMPALPSKASYSSLPTPPCENGNLPAAPQSVLNAGTQAQERRFRSRPVLPEDSAEGTTERLSLLPIPVEADSLSVINEHASDAGTGKPLSSPRSSLSRPTSCGTHLDVRDGAAVHIAVEPEGAPSGTPSVFSRETSPRLSDTSVTSLGDHLELNEPAEDPSESDDNMSDVTDHTDLSLIEAFEASSIPFQPILLSVLFSLRESVVARIRQRLHALTQLSAGNQASSSPFGTPPSVRSRGASSSVSASTSATPVSGLSSRPLPTRKRRALGDDEDDSLGRRDGDDGDKRKKSNTSSAMTELQERLTKKLACPFYKRYPSSECMSKSCRAPGWPTVHRVKEHIYRQHMPKDFTCRRCLGTFDTEATLDSHSQANPPCKAKSKDIEREVLHVTQTQLTQLRRRYKGHGIDEKARWIHTFRILFPNVPDAEIPSPYHETELGDAFSNPVIINAFRQFAGQTLPSRIAADVNDRLRVQSLGQVPETGAALQDIIRDAIHEAFGEFLPGFITPDPRASHAVIEMPTHRATNTAAPTPVLVSTPIPPPPPNATPQQSPSIIPALMVTSTPAVPQNPVSVASPPAPTSIQGASWQPGSISPTFNFEALTAEEFNDAFVENAFPTQPHTQSTPTFNIGGDFDFSGFHFDFPSSGASMFDANSQYFGSQGA